MTRLCQENDLQSLRLFLTISFLLFLSPRITAAWRQWIKNASLLLEEISSLLLDKRHTDNQLSIIHFYYIKFLLYTCATQYNPDKSRLMSHFMKTVVWMFNARFFCLFLFFLLKKYMGALIFFLAGSKFDIITGKVQRKIIPLKLIRIHTLLSYPVFVLPVLFNF